MMFNLVSLIKQKLFNFFLHLYFELLSFHFWGSCPYDRFYVFSRNTFMIFIHILFYFTTLAHSLIFSQRPTINISITISQLFYLKPAQLFNIFNNTLLNGTLFPFLIQLKPRITSDKHFTSCILRTLSIIRLDTTNCIIKND